MSSYSLLSSLNDHDGDFLKALSFTVLDWKCSEGVEKGLWIDLFIKSSCYKSTVGVK